MKTKHTGLIILLIILAGSSFAQQIPQFRHTIFSNYYYNPAFAADPEKPNIVLNHRSQWVGFDGSPTTSSLGGSYLFRDDMAAGLIIMNDKTGANTRNAFMINYAYLLNINQEWNLSFGMAWTIMQSKIDGSLIDLYDDTDEVVIENLSDKVWKPDANAGLLAFSDNYYVGFSIMQLFKSKYRLYDNHDSGIQSVRHFFIQSGAHIPLGRQAISVIHPYINMEIVGGAPFTFEFGGLWEYNESMLAGLSYSHLDAIALNLGYKYQNLTFMYSYDIIINQLMSAAKGGHEISIAYDLGSKTGNQYQPMF
ncbi:MAG: PorP/SprF family type IX secretion system membrane protein [Bacteroidales bacterium]|jgi:type IX secretion system PorP/SprF family membrane protein|nr:PorP/SprF family type IX secretion system membrane protein [Bacteroidales bacterium]